MRANVESFSELSSFLPFLLFYSGRSAPTESPPKGSYHYLCVFTLRPTLRNTKRASLFFWFVNFPGNGNHLRPSSITDQTIAVVSHPPSGGEAEEFAAIKCSGMKPPGKIPFRISIRMEAIATEMPYAEERKSVKIGGDRPSLGGVSSFVTSKS